jgi:Tfp pilus assembly protein PilV
MRPMHGREQPHAESGFAIVEVLISGMIAVIAATGIFALMQTSIHSAGDQRNRTQAYALAQEDQARMRAMRIPAFKTMSTLPRPVTIEGTKYEITSKATYVNDQTGLASCGNGTSTADYIKISSEVTWANMSPTPPTVIRSIIAPPSGTLNPKAGTLTVRAERATVGQYVSALTLSGTGTAGTFSGSTDTSGCAVFTEQPEGSYTMTISSGTSGLVNKDGEGLPANKTITVNPETTTTVDLYYDLAGKIPVTFKTTNYGGTQVAAKNEHLIAFNTEMKTAKVFGTGSKQTTLEATSLFPFTSTYTVYGGACTENNPISPTASPQMTAAAANVTAPAGSASATQSLLLPSLLVNAKRNGTATDGMAVKITDTECKVGGNYVTRNMTTSTQPPSPASGATAGRLEETGLPYGKYTVCVSSSISGTTRRESKTVELETATTSVSFEVTSSDSSGSCP